jgi:predicted NBD/HSP70 family sugar kinase
VRALPATLRLLNQRRLLELILRVGDASRAELADAAGMSRPTAGKIVDELMAAGVVEEREASPGGGRLGRPGRRVRPEERTLRFLLIEVGVRRTRLAATPVGAAEDEPWTVSYATPHSEEGFVRHVVQARAALGLRRPWAFALSVPGVVDEEGGVSLYNPNLHWTEGTRLAARLQHALGIPGCMLQEIRTLARGHIAAVPEDRDFLLVDADEGLGAAAVLGGQVFQGALPVAGELGHTRIRDNPRRCGCGATGCAETLAARPGLLAAFRHATGRARAEWSELRDEAARDPGARWLAAALDPCADVVSGALNVLGLDRVVLTGAFADLPVSAIARLGDAISGGSLAARFGKIRVTTAPRRRARGLLAGIIDRLLIPTADWTAPCSPSLAA